MVGCSILIIVFFVLSVTPLAEKIFCFLLPSNLFLFGTQKQKFDRRRRLLANVIWGVVDAFVVSIVAGLVVWKLTSE